MSKRRKEGDIVWKKANAGFVGQASYGRILPEFYQEGYDYTGPEYCMYNCDDPDCREWTTLEHCDKDGNALGGFAYHVSECEMFDSQGEEDEQDGEERKHTDQDRQGGAQQDPQGRSQEGEGDGAAPSCNT